MKKIMIVAILFICLAQVALAETEVSIDAPERVAPGESFAINTSVDPNGEPISGMQEDYEVDLSAFSNHGITEGDLFGCCYSFFNNDPRINLSENKIENIFSAIIGHFDTSQRGDLSALALTARKNGTFTLNISNVKISSPDGIPVPFHTINSPASICVSPRENIDCNDQKVSAIDIFIASAYWGRNASDCPEWDGRCNVYNVDSDVDAIDLMKVGSKMGTTYNP